jgi:hypothetical protein
LQFFAFGTVKLLFFIWRDTNKEREVLSDGGVPGGLFCQSEVQTANGRIDCVAETKKYVYCFEFKLNGTAEDALVQIDSKAYLLPWEGSGKQLFKVGVSFDCEKRHIGEWKMPRAAPAHVTSLV